MDGFCHSPVGSSAEAEVKVLGGVCIRSPDIEENRFGARFKGVDGPEVVDMDDTPKMDVLLSSPLNFAGVLGRELENDRLATWGLRTPSKEELGEMLGVW